MALTPEDVRKVARLARLRLADAEVTRFQEQLGKVLGHMADLAGLDTASVEPTAHALGLVNVLRDDVPAPSDPARREAILKNLPEREGPYAKVPKVIE